MKLLEKLIYSVLLFFFTYVVLSIGLRAFEITDNYSSHMIGGIVGTIIGMGLFMFLLVKKQ